MTRITTAEYFNCFRITWNEEFRDTANGVYVLLNLENYVIGNESAQLDAAKRDGVYECAQCIRWKPMTWRRGARLFLHQPATRPDLRREGYDISPGSINDITFTATRYQLLGSPYGKLS